MLETLPDFVRLMLLGFYLIAIIVGFKVAIRLAEFILENIHNFINFLEFFLAQLWQWSITALTTLPVIAIRLMKRLTIDWIMALQEQYKLWELYLEYRHFCVLFIFILRARR